MNRPRKSPSPLEREKDALRARVTELTHAVERLNARLEDVGQSETKYRRLHEMRLDAFALVSMDGRIREFNERFRRMVGYDADELRSLTYQDLTPERWHRYEADIIEHQVLKDGQSQVYQKEYRRKDGTVFPVELRTALFRDPVDDRPVGLGAVVRDVTSRALFESREALAESREELLALINSTDDLIWSVDPHRFGLVTFNNALRRYFAGRGIDIKPGMTPSDLLPADFAEKWHGLYTRALRDGQFVEQYVTASGRPTLLLSLNLVTRAGAVSAISVFGKDVTDRIESEKALRASESRFRTLIEDAPVAIRLNRGDHVVYANRKYLSLYRYDSARQVVGMPIVSQWAPESRDEVRAYLERFIAGQEDAFQYEGPALRHDGTWFAAHAALGPVQLPDGPAIIAYVTDITDRKRAQDALKASEEQYRLLFDEMLAGVMVFDVVFDEAGNPVDHRFVGANPAYEKLTGRRVAAELGKTAKEYSIGWPPDVVERMYRVAVTGVPIQYERFNETIGRYYETRVFSPKRGQFAHVFTDITDRKAAEAARKQTEERFRQVAESVSDFVWEVDATGLYTYTNQAVEKILGYRPDEMIGKKHFYDLFPDDVREELQGSARRMFAAKQPFRRFPNANVRKDGRLVHVETSGTPVLDERGELLGYRGADTDVTERWLNEQAERDLTRRLINAQEAERARVARELHDDFSQRLALLAINLDLLRRSPPRSVDKLRQATDRLHAQVETLAKDVRRMSLDLHPARLEQLGLTAALRGLCADLTAAHSLAIRFEARDVPRDLPEPVALCLYRVAQEALQNALKHSGTATATATLALCGAQLCLTVSDEGRGFDVAAAQRGDSLGLANMRERVRSIAGRFAVESAPGRGTRIEVVVPFERRNQS